MSAQPEMEKMNSNRNSNEDNKAAEEANEASKPFEEEEDVCLICLQPAQYPTRLSCRCRLRCCQGCMLAYAFAANATACPLCRREDVHMISLVCGDGNGQDDDCQGGGGEVQELSNLERRQAGLHTTACENLLARCRDGLTLSESFYQQGTERLTAWRLMDVNDPHFKAPLHAATEDFMNAIVSDRHSQHGYVGMAYMFLLLGQNDNARKYLEHVLEHIDADSADALKFMQYIQSGK